LLGLPTTKEVYCSSRWVHSLY